MRIKAAFSIVLLFVSFLNITAQVTDESLYIYNVNVVDIVGRKILNNQDVIVTDGKIVSIEDHVSGMHTEKLNEIYAPGKYLMSGMIDAHIHFFQTGGLYTRPDALDLRKIQPYDKEKKEAFDLTKDHFKRYLRMGVTSVVDVGGPFTNFYIRDTMASQPFTPNVWATGPLFSTYQPANLGKKDPPIILCDTKEKADSLFEKMLPYKPDFIKIWYVVKPGLTAEETYPIIEYISKKAHKAGLKLAIHATQLNTAKLAVKAGADILVHSIDDKLIPKEFIKELKQKQIAYIPTLMVHSGYINTFTKQYPNHPQDIRWANPKAYGSLKDLHSIPDSLIPAKLKSIWANSNKITAKYAKSDSIMLLNLKRLTKAGVLIVTGTDAGNIGTMHGSSYFQELEWMRKGGMSTIDILKASTINAAKAFGKENEFGSIEIGKQADLLILHKNPLEKIENLKTIHWVIQNGIPLHSENIVLESPEQVVQRQLNAYNARNIDEFMATYGNYIELYNYDGTLISKGQEKMRERYSKMFEATPNLHCEIKKRIVMGNKIIDQEYVRFNDNYVSAVAIYEVSKGKIVKVTFLR